MNFKEHFSKNINLAYPVMLTQLGQIALNYADSIMVGKVGNPVQSEINLGAVALGNNIFVILFVLAFGFSLIMTPLVAEKDIKNDFKAGADIFTHSFIINIIFGVILVAITLCASPLLRYAHQPKEVIDLAIPYLNLSAISLIPVMCFQTLRQFAEGVSLTLPATIASWTAIGINIFINYCLIQGNLGFEAMGVQGAAVGTFIARCFSMFFLFFTLLRWERIRLYFREISFKVWHRKLLRKILRLGIPTSMQMFFEVSAFTLASFIAGSIGKPELAAHQVAMQMASFSFLICTGVNVAATIRIGNEKGNRDYVKLREVGFSNMILGVIFMLSCGLIFIVFRNVLPWMFTDSSEVVSITSKLLIIAALFQLADGLQLVTMGCLRGIQDVNIPMIITFVSYWLITLPIAYIAGIKLQFGIVGVWAGLGIGLSISALALFYRFNRLSKKMILINNELD